MELFFREYGQGKPLVILHGILGISDNWASFGRKISRKGYRVMIPDQRNHGHSPHNPAFNYYALSDDLNEFLEKNGVKDPVILGHSMGGKVAMRYTLENQDKVDRLIVVDTSLRTYVRVNQHQRLIDAMLSVEFREGMSRQDVEQILREKVNDERLLQFLMKSLYWKRKNFLSWRHNLEAISYNLDAMYDGVFYSTRFERPAIFIRGGLSDYILEQDYPAILNNFPAAVFATIDDGTHWVHADHPGKFFAVVAEFLDKRS